MFINKIKSILIGHVDGKIYYIDSTTAQICAFIMENRWKSVTITDMFDSFILNTYMGGFIDTCVDQQFLQDELLPELIPMQTGEVEPPKFEPPYVD